MPSQWRLDIGPRKWVEADMSLEEDTGAITEIAPEAADWPERTEGTFDQIVEVLRDLLDKSVEAQWFTKGQAAHRKSRITLWVNHSHDWIDRKKTGRR